ncbi:MAG TPA: tetratricopeptide repeat protein [Bryobacteraceae bacterium]|nr:tetratricopeptide repeat protein [Bryobacteraceae bacterium]
MMRHPVILLAVTLAVFAPSLVAPFHFDDLALFADPVITSPSGWWFVWRPLQTRPLTWFTFWLNYQAGGEDPVGYHAVNVLLHSTAVALVYRLLARLATPEVALTAAALFALHPVQTEPVAYIYARATVLSTIFCLLSASSWLDAHWPRAIGFFAFALMSKEECVAVPFVLLLLRRAWLPFAVTVGLSLAAGLRVMAAIDILQVTGAGQRSAVSAIDYAATQGTVILRYVRLLVIPYGFTCDPYIQVVRGWPAVLSWSAVLLVTAAIVRYHRHGWWFLAGLVLLLPSSSIFPAEDLAADRRMYLPMVALAGFAALAIPEHRRMPVTAAACGVLAMLTLGRVYVWQSEERLWAEALRRAPEKVRPYIMLARVSEDAEALRLLEELCRRAPRDHRAWFELGIRRLAAHEPELAVDALRKALTLGPPDAGARLQLGAALLASGRTEEAITEFRHSLDVDPCSTEARGALERLGVTAPVLVPEPTCPQPSGTASGTGRLH